MIIQGTETLSSFIHIVSESLLTPVMILIVVGLIVVILCIGGLINERISRKTISSEELESLVRDVSFSQSHSEIETKLIKSTNKTDVLVRVGPILGLLGTLIPLGPGLAALGSGDIVTLAEALTVAFDTTVTGLVIGALAYLVSKFKKQWYESDLIVLETIAEAELETLNRK